LVVPAVERDRLCFDALGAGDVLLERYAARARDGTRHCRHDDVNRIEEFRLR
jgi:hypothetical protein